MVALAAMPFVLESACRARVVTPDEMEAFRQSWSRVKALVAVNPCIMAMNSNIEMVKQALPELVKLQPTGVYREVLNSGEKIHHDFIQELGALVAAPVEANRFKTERLRNALLSLFFTCVCERRSRRSGSVLCLREKVSLGKVP